MADPMNKEEQLFCRRLQELADMCDRRGIPTYSNFLNLNEQSLFWQMQPELSYVSCTLEGLHPMAERKIACFRPKGAGREMPAPLSVVKILPQNARFAEELSHRDYLGTLLGLGIERKKIGDIFIHEQAAYVVCTSGLEEFICKNLFRIRHTTVTCELAAPQDIQFELKFRQMSGSVASFRIDALIAMAFRLSRSKAAELIAGEKAFVNGKLTTSSGAVLKEGDIVSVRGMGRFLFCSQGNVTKKGRYFAEVNVYE